MMTVFQARTMSTGMLGEGGFSQGERDFVIERFNLELKVLQYDMAILRFDVSVRKIESMSNKTYIGNDDGLGFVSLWDK